MNTLAAFPNFSILYLLLFPSLSTKCFRDFHSLYFSSQFLFQSSSIACHLISSGVAAIVGPQDPILGSHVQSICDALDIPHVTFRISHSDSLTTTTTNSQDQGLLDSVLQPAPLPPLTSSILNPSSHPSIGQGMGKEFSINLHPSSSAFSDSLRDLVTYLNWTEVAVIYEDDVSLISLQDLIRPPSLPKNVQFIFRKSSPAYFRETLLDVKSRSIYSMVIDIKPESIQPFITAVRIILPLGFDSLFTFKLIFVALLAL